MATSRKETASADSTISLAEFKTQFIECTVHFTKIASDLARQILEIQAKNSLASKRQPQISDDLYKIKLGDSFYILKRSVIDLFNLEKINKAITYICKSYPILEETSNLFHLDTYCRKAVKIKNDEGLFFKIVQFFQPDGFPPLKEFEKYYDISTKFLVPHELVELLILPAAIASQAAFVLAQKTPIATPSPMSKETGKPVETPREHSPIVSDEEKPLDNPFRLNTSLYKVDSTDGMPLHSATNPQNENDIEKLLDFIMANQINNVIVIADSKGHPPGSCANWFKILENVTERNRILGIPLERSVLNTIQYRKYTVTSDYDGSASRDLSDKDLYKLTIRKTSPHESSNNFTLKIHYFKSKDPHSFDVSQEDIERLDDLYDLLETSPILLQAESSAIRSSFKLAFQLVARQLQKRSQDSMGNSKSSIEAEPTSSDRASLKPLMTDVDSLVSHEGPPIVVTEPASPPRRYDKLPPSLAQQSLLSDAKAKKEHTKKEQTKTTDLLLSGARQFLKLIS